MWRISLNVAGSVSSWRKWRRNAKKTIENSWQRKPGPAGGGVVAKFSLASAKAAK